MSDNNKKGLFVFKKKYTIYKNVIKLILIVLFYQTDNIANMLTNATF